MLQFHMVSERFLQRFVKFYMRSGKIFANLTKKIHRKTFSYFCSHLKFINSMFKIGNSACWMNLVALVGRFEDCVLLLIAFSFQKTFPSNNQNVHVEEFCLLNLQIFSETHLKFKKPLAKPLRN